eukprot:941148-Lingulodinium_polyedra.AAC.1
MCIRDRVAVDARPTKRRCAARRCPIPAQRTEHAIRPFPSTGEKTARWAQHRGALETTPGTRADYGAR